MSENQMTQIDEKSIILVYHTIRRAVRAIEHILIVVDEDDIQRKFKQFLDEHQSILTHLTTYIEQEFTTSDTPEAVIQFPISTSDLLSIAAKSEKQIIDEIDQQLSEALSAEIQTQFKTVRQDIFVSYDYMQALSDIWS